MASEWPVTSFGAIARIVTDKVQVKNIPLRDYVSTDSMIVDFGGIEQASKKPATGKVTRFQKGDVLFSNIRTYFKKLWLADRAGGCSNDVIVFRPKEGIPSSYLYFLLMSEQFIRYTVTTSKGTKMPRGDKVAIVNYQFKLAPPKQRLKISEELSLLVKKTVLNKKINQTLEQMAQALFKSWFVDFDPVFDNLLDKHGNNLEKAKAYLESKGAEDLCPKLTKRFEQRQQIKDQKPLPQDIHNLFPSDFHHNQDLGWIPEGWEVKTVGDIVERLKAKKRYTKKQVQKHGCIPVFEQGSDILLGYHNESAGFCASREEPVFIFGDHTCITHLSCRDFDISQNVIPLKGKEYSTYWVYYAVQGKQDFEEYRRHWSELIIKSVTTPSIAIAEAFSNCIEPFIIKKECCDKESNDLIQVRNYLLPKLISGNLKLDT